MHTLGREHDVVEAAQAAQPFEPRLLLVVADLDLAEADAPLGRRRRDLLAWDRVVVAVEPAEPGRRELDANLVRRATGRTGHPESAPWIDGGGAPAVGDRVDQVARALGDVTSGPDPRIGGAQRVGIDSARRPARVRSSLDVGRGSSESAPWPTARITVSAGITASVPGSNVGREPTVGVEHRRHRDRLEARHPRVADEPVRAAPVDDRDALALGLVDLLGIGRDLVGRLERDDGDVEHAGPDARPGRRRGSSSSRGAASSSVGAGRPATGSAPCRVRRRPHGARCGRRRTRRCRRRRRRPARPARRGSPGSR